MRIKSHNKTHYCCSVNSLIIKPLSILKMRVRIYNKKSRNLQMRDFFWGFLINPIQFYFPAFMDFIKLEFGTFVVVLFLFSGAKILKSEPVNNPSKLKSEFRYPVSAIIL